MKRCRACGKELEDYAKYCSACGKKCEEKRVFKSKPAFVILFAFLVILVWYLFAQDGNSSDQQYESIEDESITATTELKENTTPVDNWQSNILMASPDRPSHYDKMENENVFRLAIERKAIKKVTFKDSTEAAPPDSVDVSHAMDGEVLAWVENGTELFIAADGGINGALSCKDMFRDYSGLETVNFNGCFHTESADNLTYMFYGCGQLQNLDLGEIRIADNADLSFMFYNCPGATSFDWSKFDTSKVEQGNYLCFMNEFELVDGWPWEHLFPSMEWEYYESNIGISGKAEHILIDTWDTGSIKIRIYNKDFMQIELTESFINTTTFQSGSADLILALSHDEGNWHSYQITFEQNESNLLSDCGYYAVGYPDENYEPEEFSSLVNDGTITINIRANANSDLGLDDFTHLYLFTDNHQTHDEEILWEKCLEESATWVQFQHFEGPDENAGGEDTEKAIVIGYDTNGEALWEHHTDVMDEIYQSSRVAEIGYVNDRYYYIEDGALIILNGSTGDVIKKINNFGSSCTDWHVETNGTMYFCCYWNPVFVALDNTGKIIHKIDSVESEYSWAKNIDVKNGKAYITMDLGPDPYKDYVVAVNLNNYKYDIDEYSQG